MNRPSARLWMVAVAIAVLAGAAVVWVPTLGLLVVGLLVFAAATALSPGFALGSILVSALIMLGLQSLLGLPVQAMLFTKLLIGVFALSVLVQLRRGRNLPVHLAATIAWIAVLAISATVGVSDRVLSLQALWAYVCGPVAFLAIVLSDISVRSLRRISIVIGCIAVAELPIVLYQNAFVATSVDRIGGTFGMVGGTSIVAIVMGFVWTVAVAVLTDHKRRWLIPIALAVATILLVSQAKAGFLFCAIGTIAVGLTRGARTRRFATVSIQYVGMAAAAVATLFAGYTYAGAVLKGGEQAAALALADIGSERAIMRYLFSYGPQGQAGRLEGVRLALNQGRSALADGLIGKGPGLFSYSALFGGSSALQLATGTIFDWSTSLTRSILETGILGTLLYVGVVGSAVWTVVDSWRSRSSALAASVVAACVGLATVYLVSGLYAAAWHTDAVAVVFWCLMGMAAKWGQSGPGPQPAPGALSADAGEPSA
jgi:hypothetical protein